MNIEENTNTGQKQPEYFSRVTQMTVMQKGTNVFSDTAMTVTIVDDGAGEYLEVAQSDDFPSARETSTVNRILITDVEWPVLKETIEELFKEIKKHEA